MLFVNVTVELSGMKRIVIDQEKVYDRDSNNDWIEKKTGKIVPDHIMMRRIKKMLNEDVTVYGAQVDVNYNKNKISENDNCILGYIHKYRLWTNMETINIERNMY